MNTSTGIAVALAVAIALSFMFLGSWMESPTPVPQEEMVVAGEANTTLMITDDVIGTGAEAKVGDRVVVTYVGQFQDGTIFDASERHEGSFPFTIGAGDVIKGWDQGVVGMKEGGKRRLTVPPELGYGPNQYGPIPGNSTLIFDIELLKVER